MNNSGSNDPLVSIIMNCRDSETYLQEAIDSVYAQSYKNWEIIFWDNASTDGSAAIAKSYDAKVRYFKNNRGLALGMARNLALAEAKGRYLVFLDCDDKWLPEKLKKQTNVLENREGIDFVYTNYFRMIMPQTGRLILGLKGRQPEGDVFGRFLYNYPVNLQTVMLRMDVINKLNVKFDDQLELSEEFDFFMRILLKSKALYINEPLAIYRVHQNMSSLKLQYKYPAELEYIKDKFRRIDGAIEQKYRPSFRYFEAKVGYWCAKVEMERHNPKSARLKLAPYRFLDIRFFILYLCAYLPAWLWKWLHRYKLSGKLR